MQDANEPKSLLIHGGRIYVPAERRNPDGSYSNYAWFVKNNTTVRTIGSSWSITHEFLEEMDEMNRVKPGSGDELVDTIARSIADRMIAEYKTWKSTRKP